MKREDDGSCGDGSDPEVAAPSVSRVSSSTNGNGTSGLNSASQNNTSVISSPLRRQLEEAAQAAARAHLVGNALVALGQEVVSAAAAAVPIGLVGGNGNEAANSRLSSISTILDTLNARSGSLALTSELSRNHRSSSSKKSSGASSEGSNSTSPLSLNMVSGGGRPGPKPRAADSPGSGSTTSTTTGAGTGRDKVFRCLICDRSFGYKHVLQNHERTHTGEKPFECGECHKRFTRDHHLKTHMRLHTGEKPYHCEHCDRQFVQVANLRRHLRVHTGERPYECELCQSKFSDSNQLKAHNLIHRGEKPFNCDKCDGKFRRRHHMMNHKCPKDEANIGRPRRGRRPKAYDSPPHHSPTMASAGLLSPHRSFLSGHGSPTSLHDLIQPSSLSTSHLRRGSNVTSSTSQLMAAAASGSGHLPSHPLYTFQLPNLPHLPSLLTTSAGVVSPKDHYRNMSGSMVGSGQPSSSNSHQPPPAAHSASGVHESSGSSSKTSRRKPKQPSRILTQQQKDIFIADHGSVQTQPLNMSTSSKNSRNGRHSLQDYKRSAIYSSGHHSAGGQDGQQVLDLSRSRSDFDSEPEDGREEDLDDDDDTIHDDGLMGDVEDHDMDDVMMDEDDGSYPDEDDPQDLSSNNNNLSSPGAVAGNNGNSSKTGPVVNSGNGITYVLVKTEPGKRNGI